MTDDDIIRIAWLTFSSLGTGLLAWILREYLYPFREAARIPASQNGRRGFFAAILLRFARVTFVLYLILMLAGVNALLNPSDVDNVRGIVSLAIIGAFDLAWWYTLSDLRKIRRYGERHSDHK